MPFRTFCDNKGCMKEMTPLIDKKSDKVYCSECQDEVNSVNPFMKRQLVSMGQVRTNDNSRMPYAVTCPHCNKKGTPKLSKDSKVLCGECAEDITKSLSAPFIQLLKSVFKK